MLKSTHRPRAPSPPPPSLPPGWTEHTAPTGHKYYYNADTKTSTYTRPTAEPQHVPAQAVSTSADFISLGGGDDEPGSQQWAGFGAVTGGSISEGGSLRHHERKRPRLEDRPKHKYNVPGAEPWVLVQTRLGRRFVHNTETSESLWRFPENVMEAVIKWDVQRLTGKPASPEARGRREQSTQREQSTANPDDEDEESTTGAPKIVPVARADDEEELASDEEYEGVEVTDDEGDEGGHTSHQRADDQDDVDEEPPEDQPMEFNEDDIAWQLQQMGEEYGLDEGEYGMEEDGQWDEGAEGLPLTEEDSQALFKDLLDDHKINPYRTWEQIIDDGRIIEDDRYTALPNMRSRKETFSDWSRERIQVLKEQRAREEKKDPKIPYLAFLQREATPKLYWPEFKRKFRKEAEMRDTKVQEKEKEKLYREHVKRIQLPEATRKSDLSSLLKAQPLSLLNQSTSSNALPPAILSDLRFISLLPDIRDPLIDAYIATLPPPPEDGEAEEEDADAIAKRKDRERREKALAERERRVEEEKRRQRRDLEYGKGRLREEEYELERAMRVDDRGLRSQLSAANGTSKQASGED